MNHPKRDEWVPYLFGEAKPETRKLLKEHLKSCAECRHEIENWQRSLTRLDSWKLPTISKVSPIFAPFLSWATAAALVLLLGFVAGRLTARADVQKVRAAIEPAMRQELGREFARLVREQVTQSSSATLAAAGQQTDEALTVLARAIEERRADDNRAIYAAFDKLASENVAQFVSLKKELDTVAVNTDAGLRNTQQELIQLAGRP
jgi:hypothetical protein